MKAIKDMTASEINKELDRFDTRLSSLNDRFIVEGRGHERPSETVTKTDELSVAWRACAERIAALHVEIARRYGPGAPRRLPVGRGFGPIHRYGTRG